MERPPQSIPTGAEQDDTKNFLGTGQCTQCSTGYFLDQWFYECFECKVSLCLDCYQTRHTADHMNNVVSVRFRSPSSVPLRCRLCWNNSTCCYACDECTLMVCRGCWHFRFNAGSHQHHFYSVTETSIPHVTEAQYALRQGHALSSSVSRPPQVGMSSELDKATVSFPESPSYLPSPNLTMEDARIQALHLTEMSSADAVQYIHQTHPLDSQRDPSVLRHQPQTGSTRYGPGPQAHLAGEDYSAIMESNLDHSHVSHPLYQTMLTPTAVQMPTPSDSTATPGGPDSTPQALNPEFTRRLSLHRPHSRSGAANPQRPAKTKRQPSVSSVKMSASGRDSPISDSGRIIKRSSSRASNTSSHALEELRRQSSGALNTPRSTVGIGSPRENFLAVDTQVSPAGPSSSVATYSPVEWSATATSPEADPVTVANTSSHHSRTWTDNPIALTSPITTTTTATTQSTAQQQQDGTEALAKSNPNSSASTQHMSTYLQLAQAQLQREHAYAKIQAQARAQAVQVAEAAAASVASTAAAAKAATHSKSAGSTSKATKAVKKEATVDEPEASAGAALAASEVKGAQQQEQRQKQQQEQQQGNLTLQQRMSLLTSEAQLNWAAIEAFANMPVGL